MKLKPSFLTRISNLIILQLIFVFSALALFLFTSNESEKNDVKFFEQDYKFKTLALHISEMLAGDSLFLDDVVHTQNIQQSLDKLLAMESEILQVKILMCPTSDNIEDVYTYISPLSMDDDLISDQMLEALVGNVLKQNDIKSELNEYSPVFYKTDYLLNFVPFKINNKISALLVTISDHDYMFSSRSDVKYGILLLFLVSSLIALLTVYLISVRFKSPLNELILGFEKTSQGEFNQINVANDDEEIKRLTNSYNNMSQKLSENYNSLKESNTALEDSNKLLNESRAFLLALVEDSPDCVISTDNQGMIKVFNNKASETFGYEKEQMLDQHINVLFTQSMLDVIKNSEHKENDEIELLGKRKDNSIFPVFCICSNIDGHDSEYPAYLFIVRDISESKSFQEMMIRIDRYYTRGEMAGDIAHEINNYLAVLSGNLELIPIFMRKGKDEKIAQKLELMRGTVDKVARFANGLMDANHEDAVFNDADINQLIENVIAFLKPQNRFDSVELKTELSTELPLIKIDIAQIQQLLINLIYNSAEAIQSLEGEKQISLRSSFVKHGNEKFVQIDIKDNGTGVPEEKKDVLFEKRFTTKRKGHGIGLVTCKKIVDGHVGTIEYKYDNGALFSFKLPVEGPGSDLKEESKVAQVGVTV